MPAQAVAYSKHHLRTKLTDINPDRPPPVSLCHSFRAGCGYAGGDPTPGSERRQFSRPATAVSRHRNHRTGRPGPKSVLRLDDPSASGAHYIGTRGVFRATTAVIADRPSTLACSAESGSRLASILQRSGLCTPGPVNLPLWHQRVFKSSNVGKDWATAGSGLPDEPVVALAIDPKSPATIYAGTEAGVFKSSDSGESWKDINVGLTSTYVRTLVIDPSAPTTVYAGTQGGGVFKTSNGGRS